MLMKSSVLTSSMDEAEIAKIGTAPPGTQTLEMRYSVPKMFVSMAMDDTLDLNAPVDFNGNEVPGPPTGHLSPIKKKRQHQLGTMSQSLDKPLKGI